MTAPPSGADERPRPRGVALVALGLSIGCTLWLGVEILLRVVDAPTGLQTAAFVVAVALAAGVVALAILAWRRHGRTGALFGFVAIAMAASDRIALALLTATGAI